MPISNLSHDEVSRIYGPWTPRRPVDAAELFAGYQGHWWVAGGWAIEAFSGVERHHSDLDLSIPRSELSLLRSHVAGQVDLWTADQDTLRVLIPEDAGHDDHRLSDSCENVWARKSGGDPWEYDIILMNTVDERWVYKRDARITLPLDEIVWTQGGVRYLRPEIQLLHKSAGLRPKDQADFAAAWPVLDAQSRRWLRKAIELTHPSHRWLSAMS